MWPCSTMKLYTEIKNKKFSEVFEFQTMIIRKKKFSI